MNTNTSDLMLESNFGSLCKSIGFLVIQWGQSEQSLELLVNVIFRDYGGSKWTKQKRLPRQLDKKLAFIKECASAIPALATFRIDLEALVVKFKLLSQMRHDLVHGALVNIKEENDVYSFIRLNTHPDVHEAKEFRYALTEFPVVADAFVCLGRDTQRLAERVFIARPITS